MTIQIQKPHDHSTITFHNKEISYLKTKLETRDMVQCKRLQFTAQDSISKSSDVYRKQLYL